MKRISQIVTAVLLWCAAIGSLTGVGNAADRHPEEPLSATPSIDRTMALVVRHGQLLATTSSGDLGNVSKGWVTIGHEVRSFKTCDGENDLWLMGQSPALKAIIAAYQQALHDHKDYRPLFMVLSGKQVEPPALGFGADYDAAFLAMHLVRVVPGASCTNDPQDIDSVNGYMQKITFDISTLDEDGLYGPSGGKRALSYECCILNTVVNKAEVKRLDPTVAFFTKSPGRIGCGTHESLCIGSAHQQDFAIILRRLAELPYVQRIDQSFFE